MTLSRSSCLKSNIAAKCRLDLRRLEFRPALRLQRPSPQHHCLSSGQHRSIFNESDPLLLNALRSAADNPLGNWSKHYAVLQQCPELWQLVRLDIYKKCHLEPSANRKLFSTRDDFDAAGWQIFRELSEVVSKDAKETWPILTAQQRMVLESRLENAVKSMVHVYFVFTWINRIVFAAIVGLSIYCFRYILGIVARPEYTKEAAE